MKRIIKIASILLLIVSMLFFLYKLSGSLLIKPQEEVTFTQSKVQDGIIRKYFTSKNLQSEEMFVKGLKSGKGVYYYDNGNIESVKYYEQNKLEGSAYFFAEEGELILINTYKNDKLLTSKVVNDSIYNREVNIVNYGELTFTNNCAACHLSPNEIDLQRLLEKQGDAFISISGVHESLLISKEPFDSLNQLLSIDDLGAIQTYILSKRNNKGKKYTERSVRYKPKKG